MSDADGHPAPDVPETSTTIPQRLLWLMKPLGGLLIVLWVISPGTADRASWQPQVAWAFLLGACYGAFVFYADFQKIWRHVKASISNI